MAKNCWEYKGCGREPGGAKEAQMGVCPAATNKATDGKNHGKNGGRNCWALAGTFCGGKVQGSFAEKKATCMTCEVMQTIKKEEGASFVLK